MSYQVSTKYLVISQACPVFTVVFGAGCNFAGLNPSLLSRSGQKIVHFRTRRDFCVELIGQNALATGIRNTKILLRDYR